MSYLNSHYDIEQDLAPSRIGSRRIPSPRLQVEVILLEINKHSLIVKSDERSMPVKVGGNRIKIVSRRDNLATLEMTERQAIQYNLV